MSAAEQDEEKKAEEERIKRERQEKEEAAAREAEERRAAAEAQAEAERQVGGCGQWSAQPCLPAVKTCPPPTACVQSCSWSTVHCNGEVAYTYWLW